MEGKVMIAMKHQYPEIFAKLPSRVLNLTIIKKSENTAKVIYFDSVTNSIDWRMVTLDSSGIRVGNNIPIQSDRIDLQSIASALSFALH